MTKEQIAALKDKFMKKLKDIFTPAEITELNKHVKLSMDPPAGATPTEVKTKEGASVFIAEIPADGILVKGLKVFADAAGTTPMADGKYNINGAIVTVTGGVIADVVDEQVEAAKDLAQMSTNLSKQTKDLTIDFNTKLSAQKKAFEAEIAALKESNKVFASFVQKVLEAEIVTELSKEEKDKNRAKLPHEEFLANRKRIA